MPKATKTLDALCRHYGVAKLEIPLPCIGSEPGILKLLVQFSDKEYPGEKGLRRYFGLQDELAAFFPVPIELDSENNHYYHAPVDRRTLYAEE